jgi:hypothetical protein
MIAFPQSKFSEGTETKQANKPIGARSISASGTGVPPVIHAQAPRATSKQDTAINR